MTAHGCQNPFLLQSFLEVLWANVENDLGAIIKIGRSAALLPQIIAAQKKSLAVLKERESLQRVPNILQETVLVIVLCCSTMRRLKETGNAISPHLIFFHLLSAF